MGQHSTHHTTVVLARTLTAPADRVFAAVTDPAERLQVAAANKRFAYELQETDVRPGGRDIYSFAPDRRRRFIGECLYHEITPERIVCTDIVTANGVRIWIGMTTIELSPLAGQTKVRLTRQIVWLDDGDAHEGADGCHSELLDDLERYFARA
jgi:uncharacterized protein YndB with AHSA1/START domain